LVLLLFIVFVFEQLVLLKKVCYKDDGKGREGTDGEREGGKEKRGGEGGRGREGKGGKGKVPPFFVKS